MSYETDALLGNHRCAKQSLLYRVSKHLRSDLDPTHGDLVLLFCYVITGLLDSSAVLVWGSFVSMQTGNTVYFGLGLFGTRDDRWIRSGVSIAGFCLGSWCFATFHRVFPARRRWVLCASFLAQTLCVGLAASIVTIHRPAQGAPLNWLVLVPVALIAFQSSGQAVTSRVLNFTGLTSVVLTSTYCDLFSHPDFFSTKLVGHAEEMRRIGAILCLLVGVVLGGFWAHSDVEMMGALWTAVIMKSMIVGAWLVWSGKMEDTE
ncbi:DUF1275 domain protein [Penicillium digitatum]|uniref:DUF1275 domain protein n=3 Tax=Penicillium digitatum TaxID=36651 RepID=K9FBF0_PEND2|nr:hypothetical protein PDIP_04430 [Penicillium digitatum Pd1]EKV06534.1 hypothetical protein PDIG_77310 [Penicillium digitatum PHI26]EKV21636.1 hypothetical protein PDIP_04430 [Penicillium digitatum Pd1]KAG0154469.1 hypothetical protein PDIDSM_37 [Penicillium digitatum]QQK47472.1 DUF1275 domain protein [Penicillium digitatum]